MQSWRTRSRRTLLDRSPWLSVESHVVELPDGRVIEDWPWLVGREFVNVLAVTEAGELLVFRQVKYAVDGTSLAPVGGYLDDGEDPLAAARREVLEETGLEVEVGEVLATVDLIERDGDRVRYHYTLIDFSAEALGPALRPGGDAADARWFTLAEVERLGLWSETVRIIRLAQERRGAADPGA